MLAQSFKDGLSKTAFSEDASIQSDLEDMFDLIRSIKVKVHDELDIVYTSKKKLKVFFNGDERLKSNNPMLAKALLGMFLGEKHPDKAFQKKLIGQ